MSQRKALYEIRNSVEKTGEFLRSESSDDAYSPDLGEALIYDDYADAGSIRQNGEDVVIVTWEEDGCLKLGEVIR